MSLSEWVPPSVLSTVPRRVDSRLRGIRFPLTRTEARRAADNPTTNPFAEYGRALGRRSLEWYQDCDAVEAWQNEGGA